MRGAPGTGTRASRLAQRTAGSPKAYRSRASRRTRYGNADLRSAPAERVPQIRLTDPDIDPSSPPPPASISTPARLHRRRYRSRLDSTGVDIDPSSTPPASISIPARRHRRRYRSQLDPTGVDIDPSSTPPASISIPARLHRRRYRSRLDATGVDIDPGSTPPASISIPVRHHRRRYRSQSDTTGVDIDPSSTPPASISIPVRRHRRRYRSQSDATGVDIDPSSASPASISIPVRRHRRRYRSQFGVTDSNVNPDQSERSQPHGWHFIRAAARHERPPRCQRHRHRACTPRCTEARVRQVPSCRGSGRHDLNAGRGASERRTRSTTFCAPDGLLTAM